MNTCGLTLVRNSADPDGYQCGAKADAVCGDCGTPMCDLHTEECDFCQRFFCVGCVGFHRHSKAIASVFDSGKLKQRAS